MKDDAQLIAESLAGHSASFGALVVRYQNRLYNTTVHFIGSADEAYDVTQDTFVQAFLKLESLQNRGAFYGWVCRIAFNLAKSRQRRRKPCQSIDQLKDAVGQEPLDPSAGPDARMEQQERATQMQAAMDRLSDEHRTILILREIDGCDYETIGQVLDVPVGTVRSRIYRARMQLRDVVQETMPSELPRTH